MEQQVLVKKVSADGKIGIPERFRTTFRIKAGDDVFWQMVEDEILIAKIYPVTRSSMELPKTAPETRRKLRAFAQRMDRSESMTVTLRKVRAEAYRVIQDNQAWVDRVMMSSQGTG